MSWQPKTQDNLIKQLIREQNKLRDVVYRTLFGSFAGAGIAGQGGFGFGGSTGSASINHYHPNLQTVTNLNAVDVVDSTDGYSHIRASDTIIVCEEAGSGNTPSDTNPQVKWIDQTLFDGTLLLLTPKEGKTLTLLTGGNINVSSNTTVSSDEIIYLQFLEEHPTSGSGTHGSYNLLKSSGGGSADNLGNHTATTNLNMAGNQINRIDQLWFDTDDQNDASIQASSNGLAYVSDNDDTGTYHTFYTGGSTTSHKRLSITDSAIYAYETIYMDSANLQMEGGEIQMDADNDTKISASVDDQLEVECGASSGHFQVSTGGNIRFKVDNSNITLIGNVNIANLVGSQSTTIGYDVTSFLYLNAKVVTNIGMDNNTLIYAKEADEKIGFHVSNYTTIGSRGTMEIPYYWGSSYPSDSTLNGYYGSESGCIGVFRHSSGTDRFYFNTLDGWNYVNADGIA